MSFGDFEAELAPLDGSSLIPHNADMRPADLGVSGNLVLRNYAVLRGTDVGARPQSYGKSSWDRYVHFECLYLRAISDKPDNFSAMKGTASLATVAWLHNSASE